MRRRAARRRSFATTNRGKTLGVDGTTLEANAALRSIVRRDNGQGYTEYLTELAQAEGVEAPTREELARLDRKRPKKGSNAEWVSPSDPDAQIMKMKDGPTSRTSTSTRSISRPGRSA